MKIHLSMGYVETLASTVFGESEESEERKRRKSLHRLQGDAMLDIDACGAIAYADAKAVGKQEPCQ